MSTCVSLFLPPLEYKGLWSPTLLISILYLSEIIIIFFLTSFVIDDAVHGLISDEKGDVKKMV